MRKLYFIILTCFLININYKSFSQIVITKSADQISADPGVPITYTLQIKCPSTSGTCNNIVINDYLNSHLDYLGASAPTGNVQSINHNPTNNQVTITMNPVLNGTTDEVQIVAAVKSFTENGLIIPNFAQSTSGVNSNTVNVTVTNGFEYFWTDNIYNYKDAIQEASAGNGTYYSFMWSNNSQNYAINNLVFIEDIPSQMRVTNFSPVTYTDASGIFYNIYYRTNLNSTWTLGLGGNYDLATKYYLSPSDIGVPGGQYITELRFNYLQPIPGGGQYYQWLPNLDMGRIIGTIDPSTPIGTVVNNCISSTGTMNGVPKTASHCASVTTSTPTQGFVIEKEIPNQLSGYLAGDTLTFNLIGGITEVTGFDYVNPTVIDLLPPELEFISYTATELWEDPFGGTNLQPLFTKIDNYLGTGQTYLKFRYNYTITRQASRIGKAFQIQIKTKIKNGVPSGEYINKSYHTSQNGGEVFPSNWWAWSDPSLYEMVIDNTNLDADASYTDTLYAAYRKFNVVFPTGAGLESIKWVKGTLDADYTRYPVVGNTSPGGTADYKLQVKNSGNVALKNIKVIDILPFVGDKGVIDLSNRNSQWRPYLIDEITSSNPGVSIHYSTVSNPCREELTPGVPSPCDNPNWSTIPPLDITTVQSLKFDFGSLVMQPNDVIELNWPMRVPLGAPTNGETAWNSFGYIATRDDNNSVLLASEPIKVGVKVLPAIPPVIGNYVWEDVNANGLQDEPANKGLNNILVQLYKPLGSTPNPAIDSLVSFTLTSNDEFGNPGYYEFSNETLGNRYLVFHNPGGDFLVSPKDSTANDNIDSDGNSIILSGGEKVGITDIFSVSNLVNNTFDQGFHHPCYSPVTALASNNGPVCVGSSATLTGAGSGATLFSWTGPNSFTSNSQNPVISNITTANAGIYTLITSNGTACSATATTSLSVPNITIANVTVSSCIDQPLQDISKVDVTISWTDAQVNDIVQVKIFNKIEYINTNSLTSPQTISFNVPADGSTNNNISAYWQNFGSGTCGTNTVFNSPIACSTSPLNCEKILFLCGNDKPVDGDAFDHGFIDYLNITGANTVMPALVKPDATGLGFYDPMNQSIPISVNINDYTMIIISPTTEGYISTDLLSQLKNYRGGILMMNYLEADNLGYTASPLTYSFQDFAYFNNTNSAEIYNYDNINPYYNNVLTAGTYYSNADANLWINSNDSTSKINGIYFKYSASDVLPGVSNIHGKRVFLGYHMNELYYNAQNGGALPAPSSSYLTPSAHFTTLGKSIFDQAIVDAATGLQVFAIGDTVCLGNTIQLAANSLGGAVYSWSGPNGFSSNFQNPSISGATLLANGIYTVTVFDGYGCSATATTQVFVNPIATLTSSQTNVLCFGNTTGQINITANGGTAPYTYDWADIAGTNNAEDRTGLAAGTYTVTVTDANGCSTAPLVITISQPASLPTVAITSQTNVLCFGNSTGQINITANGGTAPYTYDWADIVGTNNAEDRTGLAAGTYTVTVTDANGCSTAPLVITISQPANLPTVAIASQTNVLCFGNTTGQINITADGGTAPYTYDWADIVGTNNAEDRTGLAAGTYTVTVTDANGCSTAPMVVTISQPANLPTVAITSQTNVLCFGNTTGQINITANGGTAPYTYDWADIVGTNNAEDRTGLAAGTYTVTVTDANGCSTAPLVITISQPANLPTVATTSQTNVLCFGNTTGQINITANGGTAPYTYDWADIAGTNNAEDRTGLAAGTYTVTVTDANGCSTAPLVITISQPANLPTVATTSQTNVLCFGNTTGQINITANGGTAPYTYDWADIAGTNNAEDRTGLAAGTYTVTVTDANGCSTAPLVVTISQPANLPTVAIASQTNVLCFGNTTGQINITANGGTAPYTYDWADIVGTNNAEDRTGLAAGTYTVTVTDANGCSTAPLVVTISQPADLPNVAIASQTNVLCFGNTTGQINITANGGTAPYTYDWADIVGTNNAEDRTGLAAGTYTVTVTDANGCSTAPLVITISQPANLPTVATTSQTNVLCFGNTTGQINITANGGTAPYTYDWADIAGTNNAEDRTGLAAGTYTVTVTDANGCSTAPLVITISQPANLPTVATTSQTNVLCFGNTTGQINITANGGTAPYTYDWADIAGTNNAEDRTGLAAGTYTVTVTDANGCSTAPLVITISQPANLPTVATTSQTNVLCFGNTTGQINITTNGGTAPYTYDWADIAGTNNAEDRTGLAAGTYTVTVTDANGCSTAPLVITISQPANLPTVATTSQTNVLCFGNTTGQINITANGGTAPYTYDWADIAGTNNAEDRTGLAAGTYTVTVTDANGCSTAPLVITISQPANLPTVATTSQTNVLCFGNTTGQINITANGGTAPYTYDWADIAGTNNAEDRTGLAAGTYTVTVTDANGCSTAPLVVTISQPANLPTVAIASQTNVLCFGNTTGQINITANGGTAPYTYDWADIVGTNNAEDRTGLAAGTYTVTVTDANGCSTAPMVVTISQPANLPTVAITSQTNVLCFGNTTGQINITANGGTAPYTYDWADIVGTNNAEDRTGLAAGTYTVTVTDANGCSTAPLVITISQPANLPTVATTSQTNVLCFGNTTGQINITANGGTAPYTYDWADIAGTNNAEDRTGLAAGTYTVTVTDANGCSTAPLVITISQPANLPTVATTSQTNVLCFGNTTGQINITANGGTAPYTYDWADIAGTNNAEDRTGLAAGTYTVTVTDANGCSTAPLVVTISQPANLPTVAIASQTNVLCFGNTTGQINITANGGTAPYTYDWADIVGTNNAEDRTGLAAGTYTVTVTDANGCSTAPLVVTISQPADLPNVAIASQTNVLCFGNTTGQINITANGGTAPYTYDWADTVGTNNAEDRTGLAAGTYTVTVTDANGCSTAPLVITISQPANLPTVATTSQTNVLCFGNTTGQINITANGGTAPYTYDWADIVGTNNAEDRTGLAAGTYTVTVTDANGCSTAPLVITISQPADLVSSITSTPVLCHGDNNGTATVFPTGGAGGYTYLWSNSQITNTASNLIAGTYSVLVTDINGCTTNSSVEIMEPLPLGTSILENLRVTKLNGNDGSATVNATGGTQPYSYLWDNTEVTQTALNLTYGLHNVIITDNNGCTISASIFINQYISDLILTKTISDPSPNVGDVVTFTVTVSNAGPDAATNVAIEDAIPNGFGSISNISVAGVFANDTLTWSGLTIASGGSVVLTYQATVLAPGVGVSFTNIAQVIASDQFDPNSTPDNDVPIEDDYDSVTPVPQVADLSLSKNISSLSPNVGDVVTFTVTVSNAGPDAATNVAIEDAIPNGYGSIGNISGAGVFANDTLTWSGLTIASGGSVVLTYQATVLAPGLGVSFTNVAQVIASDQFDPNSTPDNDIPSEDDYDSVTPVTQIADLSLSKNISSMSPNVGDVVTFTISVNNSGPDAASNVAIEDAIPNGYGSISNISSAGVFANDTLTWNGLTIASGGSAVLTYEATVLAPGMGVSFTNVAQVIASDQFDPNSTPDNGLSSEDDYDSVTPEPQVANLSLSKNISSLTPNVGDVVTFTVTVSNAGPDAATNVAIEDAIPNGYGSISNISGAGVFANDTLTWNGLNIASGASAVLTYQATVLAPGLGVSFTNVAQVIASDQFDPNSTPDNDLPTEDDYDSITPVPQVADLSLSKNISSLSPNVGDVVTFTLTVSNAGPDAATNVAIEDAIPNGYGSISNISGAGVFVNDTLTWNGLNIASGASAVLTYQATVLAPGLGVSFTNVAQVIASDQFDPNSTPDNDVPTEGDYDSVTPVPQVANLSLSKNISSLTPNVGDMVTFTVTVSNAGPDAASNVAIEDAIPNGYGSISNISGAGVFANDTLTWNGLNIASGASAVLTYQATVLAPGVGVSFTNVAQVIASDQFDPNSTPDNDVPSEDDYDSVTPVPQVANLSLSKNISSMSPNVGDVVTFTISVNNAGPDAATNVAIEDAIPNGYGSISNISGAGVFANDILTWSGLNIASGASAVLTYQATVMAPGGGISFTNVAQVIASDQFDPNSTPDNDVPTEDDYDSVTPIPQVANLSLSKNISSMSPNVGDVVTFTVTVSNAGPDAATNVAIEDAIPNGYGSISNISGAGVFANDTLTWNGLTIVSGASAVLTYQATVMAPGVGVSFTNVAQVIASDQFDPNSTTDNDVPTEDDYDSVTPVPQIADLSLSKNISSMSPNVGDVVTFTLTVSNAGPDAATNVAIEDAIPNGYGSISNISGAGVFANDTLTWSSLTIASGSSVVLTYEATVLAPGLGVSFTNVAQVIASDQFDPNSTTDNDVPTEDDYDSITPVPQVADLSLSKNISSLSPNVGDVVTFTLTVSNAGPDAATNVAIEDAIPNGYGSISNISGAGVFVNDTLTWNGLTIASGGSVVLTYEATVLAPGFGVSFTNVAQVIASDQFDPNSTPDNDVPSEDDYDSVTPVPQVADLSLSKNISSMSPNVGDVVTFTITVSNAGPDAATNVAIEDAIPNGYGSISNISGAGVFANDTLTWSGLTIASGGSVVLTYEATVLAPGLGVSFTNVAQVIASDQFDPNSTPDNDLPTEDDYDSITPVPQVADLSLSKNISSMSPNVGDVVTFTISVNNAGPDAATNVAIEDAIPNGYGSISNISGAGVFANDTLTWSSLNIASGASAVLTYQATVLAPGVGVSFTNVAQVIASDQFDPNSTPDNDIPSEDDYDSVTPVPQVADLSLSKNISSMSPNVGDVVTFTISVNNAGPDAATNVAIEDAIPNGYGSIANISGAGVFANDTLTWNGLTIASGGSVVLTYQATVLAPGLGVSFTNVAQVIASDQFDPNSMPDNDVPTEDDYDSVTPGAQIADLSLSKNISSMSPNVGDVVTFTLTVSNAGPDAATNVAIEDAIPNGYGSISNISGAGVYANDTLTWSGLNIASGASAVLTYQATVLAPGVGISFTNVAQVIASDQFDPNSTPDNDVPTEDDYDSVTPVPQVANLSLSKNISSLTPNVGDVVTFTVTVNNAGPDAATNVAIEDAIPNGYGSITNISGAGVLANDTLTWSGLTIASGASAVLTYQATVLAPGVGVSYTNVAQVIASDQFDPNSTPDNDVPIEDDYDSVTPVPQVADLSLSKNISSLSPNVGDVVTFTVTVNNAGPDAATNVAIEDAIPNGYGSITNISGAGVLANDTLTWSGLTIASGASAVLTYQATVLAPGVGVSYTNVAQVIASDQFDPNSTPNNGLSSEDDFDSVTPVPQVANLSLSKNISSMSPNVGDVVTFTISVSNAGPDAATNVAIEDAIPNGYGSIANISGAGVFANDTLTWNGLIIASGGSVVLTYQATVQAPSLGVSFTNVAQVIASDQFDPNSTPDNDVPTEDDYDSVTPVPQVANLSLSKNISSMSPNVGDVVTFTVTVSNAGPDTASNVAIEDAIPNGYGSITNISGAGVFANDTLTWSGLTIASGASAVLTYQATVLAPGVGVSYTNVAQVIASDQFDPNSTPDNGLSSEDDFDSVTPVPQVANLSLSKNISSMSPNVGDVVTFTVTVSNAGPDAATNVAIEDAIPNGYGSISNISGAGVFVNDTLTWNGLNIASGASAVLTYQATVLAPGLGVSFTNVAQVIASDQFDPNSTPDNDLSSEDDFDSVTPVPQVANLSLSKNISSLTPNVGDVVTFTVTVNNAGPDAATNVAIEDAIPNGYGSISNISVAGVFANDTLTWSGLNIASGASAVLTYQATVLAPGVGVSYTNVAQVIASDQFDPNSTPDNDVPIEDDYDSVTPVPQVADLSLSKNISSLSPNVGDVVTFTVTVNNAGPDAATNVAIEDAIPNGYGSISNISGAGVFANDTLTWNGLTIVSGASAVLTYQATVMAPGLGVSFTNVAQVIASDQFDPNSTPDNGLSSEDDYDSVTPEPQVANLSLSKNISSLTPNVGDVVTFTVTVSNAGPDAATNVAIEDAIPNGYGSISNISGAGVYANDTLTWSGLTIASGGSAVLTYEATVLAPGLGVSFTNVAQVIASDQFDPNSTPDNDIPSEDDYDSVTPVPQVADLSLSKNISSLSPNVGDVVTFTLTVSNAGPDAATNVAIEDAIPNGYGSISNISVAGVFANDTLTWSGLTIASGGSVVLTYQATVLAPGVGVSFTNIAQVIASDQFDPNSTPDNDVPSEDDYDSVTPVPQVADLSLSKNISSLSPNVGDVVTFTISVNNAGPDAATNVAIEDAIPNGYGSISNISGAGVFANDTLTWSGLTIASSGSVVLTYQATVLAPGLGVSFTNVAQVIASDQFDPNSMPDNDVPTEDDYDSVTPSAQIADLSLSKNISSMSPNVGDVVTFTLTVSNAGPDAATNVAIEDAIPNGYGSISNISGAGVFTNDTLTWSGLTIASGGSVVLTYEATVLAPGVGVSFTNIAQVIASDQFDPNSTPDNDVPTEDDYDSVTPIPQVADLSLTKTISNLNPIVGDIVTFTLTINNAGPDSATNVSIGDAIPNGYGNITNISNSGNLIADSLVWNIPTILSGNSQILTYEATVLPPLSGVNYTNVAQVVGVDQFDPNSTPNNNIPTEDDQDQVVITLDNSLPIAVAGTGFTITCVDNTTGQEIGEIAEIGHTYSWSPAFGLSNVNISNPIALPSITTTYTVTKTNITNGFTATASIVVAVDTIKPIPTIIGNDTISVFQSNVLRIAQGGETYFWSNGLGTNDSVSINNPGIYTVTATGINGCTSTATTHVVEVRFGSINGLGWVDNDYDGLQESFEIHSANEKVYLFDGSGISLLDSTITDSNGNYKFDSLASGIYMIKFKVPNSAMISPANMHLESVDSDFNEDAWSETISIDVSKANNDSLRNRNHVDIGFAYFGSISGEIFNDKDFNHLQNSGDQSLPGIMVYLVDSSNVRLDSTLSNVLGQYRFDSLLQGAYKIEVTKPAGMNVISKDFGNDDTNDSDIEPLTGITEIINVYADSSINSPFRNIINVDAGFSFYDPKIRLTKDGVLVGTGLVGDKITYGFTVLNTGNITLSNVFIEDTLISTSPISVSPNVLAPNQTGFATAQYTLLPADIERGYVANSALVFGTDPIGVTVTDTSDNVNPYEPGPSDTTIVNIPKIDIALAGNSDGGCERQIDEIVTFQVIAYRQDTLSGTAILSIKDSLGANFQFISADVTGGSYDSNSNIWSNISLNFNETDTLTIKARILTSMGGYLSHSAWLISSNYNDVDSFAGDKNVTEDDYSNVFFSVPIKICSVKNESVDLTAPSGYGTYQWQLNGVSISGANSQTYTATLPGNYSIITDGNTCQSGNCCPIIVEDSCPCPPQICLPFKITKSK